jgi:hypothetical protein
MKRALKLSLFSLIVMSLLGIESAHAQSWADRVTAVKRKREQAKAQQMTPNHPAVKIQQNIPVTDLDATPFKQALEWWKQVVDVAFLVNWEAIEASGVDINLPITLKLRNAPANIVLEMILELGSPEYKMYHYETQWYVQILTRDQMLKKTEVRMYDVRDLLFQAPNFRRNAPKLGLSEALSTSGTVGGSSGNSGGGNSSTSLFEESSNSDNDEKERQTDKDRAEELIDLIRSSIEPDIWVANGGYHSSIKYYNGMLVIRAPEFVHRQIGSSNSASLIGNRSPAYLNSTSGYQTGKAKIAKDNPATGDGKSNVSAVQSKAALRNVSGVSAEK